MNETTDSTKYFTRLGQRMLAARIRARLSQRELEDKLGYKSSMVSGYETGKREPRLVTLLTFANVFGCDVRDLIPSSTSEADDPVSGVDLPKEPPPQYPEVREEEAMVAPRPPQPPPPVAAAPIKKTERVDALEDRSGAMPWNENPDPAAW